MHRFKNNVSDGWLFRQELRFFENLARNWDRDVEDCDFFDLFGDGNNSDVSEATAMLKKFFPVETLAKLDGISVERSSPDEDPDEEAPLRATGGTCGTATRKGGPSMSRYAMRG